MREKKSETNFYNKKKMSILEAQMETAIDGILVVDEKMQFIFYNTLFLKMWNVPPEFSTTTDDSILLKHILSQQKNPQDFISKVEYLYEHKEERSVDELYLKDGRCFERYSAPLLDSHGHYLGRIWYFRDLNERQRFVEALREIDQRYRVLFENSGDAIFIHDLQGKMFDVNPIACERLGYSREELLQMTPRDFNAPEHASKVSARIKILIEQKHNLFETCHVHRDGTIIPTEINSRLIEYQGHAAILSTARDISFRKQVEKEKMEMQAQLFHSSKLASVGMLASGVAHEINNPLAIIKGNTSIVMELLQERKDASDELELLVRQNRAIDRIEAIVKGLRIFARSDNDSTGIVDIHKSIQDTLALVENIFAKEDITFLLDLKSSSAVIIADVGKLQQVIMNMLTNAKDAIKERGEGGGIIQVGTIDRKGSGGGDANASEQEIVITISDNGIGMSEEQLKKIFDPFYTTKEIGKGTGLGLSISNSIITSIGGKITVWSEKGKGSIFTIILPKKCKSSKLNERGESVGSSTIASNNKSAEKVQCRGRVLIVDDEDDIRKILRFYLQSMGLEVVEAVDGMDAFTRIKQEVFLLVISDIKMPRMGGEVLFALAKELPEYQKSKFIAITGCVAGDDLDEKLEARCERFRTLADACMVKPFSKEVLAATVSQLLGLEL
ncbi:MAG: PAS domain S-box protein [Oligoflexia bacterium]|nr:PAS domain S-box protein [Oligoflexia bacterium]MBF0365062.1 PAS domain S-box protein [Oligoflexia bacterium]